MKRIGWIWIGISLVLLGQAQPVFPDEKGLLPIERREYRGIPYLCGGIGLDEREALAAMGRQYSLKLLFAMTGKEYLADIEVAIADGAGKPVFVATADGPWMYANLSPGTYAVTATMSGKAQKRTVRIGAGGRQAELRFFWKE